MLGWGIFGSQKLRLSLGVKGAILGAFFFGVFWNISEIISEEVGWLVTTLLVKFGIVIFLLFFSLQPLLTLISSVQGIYVRDKRGYQYETVKTFRMGSIPMFNNRIRVQTTLAERDQQIDSVVHSQPNIRLDVGYQFTAINDEPELVERMQISVPVLLSGSNRTTGTAATLANLKDRLENDISV